MGLKQNTLAEKMGLSNNYLSSIERGKEKPSLEVIVNICNALQVTPDYLSLMSIMIDHFVERQGQKWNNDNFA